MRIFIEVPTWLGDAVMATPSIENMLITYPEAELTIFGSTLATSIFQHHPRVRNIVIDTTKKGNRFVNVWKLARPLGVFDYAISLRSSVWSKMLLWRIRAQRTAQYRRTAGTKHQVLRYNDFMSAVCKSSNEVGALKIYPAHPPTRSAQKPRILLINPGATYGSAKRYYPEKFAEVINAVAVEFDKVLILGSPNEVELANDIVADLCISNYQNLAGTLSIEELITTISSATVMITGDSGPMHIAASFGVRIIALFGPTKDDETAPWSDTYTILKQHSEVLSCQPCMQRTCPLAHHKCMRNITPAQIIQVLENE